LPCTACFLHKLCNPKNKAAKRPKYIHMARR
jgi:hypothetical protein